MKDITSLPLNAVRRADRAVTDEEWIKDRLRSAPYGTLATVYDGQPFVNTNIFVYDEADQAIYIHTAWVGRTRTNIEHDGRVCFTVTEMGRLLPADTALEFSVEYSSVVVFGHARILEDRAEAARALQKLLDKYFPHLRPGEHYRLIQDDELKRTSVYRIDIDSWSGKRKAVKDDFPGAFLWPPENATNGS